MQVKATERFSKKGGLRAEITKNGGMQSLVQLLKADNDQELILIALSCLINFATDKQQILNFKRAEGLPAVLNLLGHPNHPVQYQALRFFESFIAPAELNKEIVRALGFVPRCIGLITSSHPGIQKTAIKMLIDLSSSQKALEAVVSGGGTPPLLSLLDHHDEDVRQQVSSLLTLLIAVDGLFSPFPFSFFLSLFPLSAFSTPSPPPSPPPSMYLLSVSNLIFFFGNRNGNESNHCHWVCT